MALATEGSLEEPMPLLSELRQTVRALLRSPGFSALALVTFALGIGVTSVIFSLVNTFLLKPLPVPKSHGLVMVGSVDAHLEAPHEVSYPDLVDLRDASGVFAEALGYFNVTANFASAGEAERIDLEVVTGNYFSMLGLEPALGRAFGAEEREGSGAGSVVVLSHLFWQNRFGGDPSVVGRTLLLNGRPFSVIGVAPQGFLSLGRLLAVDAFLPVSGLPRLWGRENHLQDRSKHDFWVMARLKPEVRLSQARAAVDLMAERLERAYPETNRGTRWLVVPENRARPLIVVSRVVPLVGATFMGLAGLVLLIACANVANLMLARAAARQKEIAVRAALGAGRSQLARLLAGESLLLAGAGGLLGLLLALWTCDWFSSLRFSTDAPVHLDISLDWRVLLFTLAAAASAGVIAALAPARQLLRLDPGESIKAGGRAGGAGLAPRRLRSGLVVAQVAVSALLLVASGLLIRSSVRAHHLDPGFRTENVLMLSVDVGDQGYEPPRGREFFRALAERLWGLPGVRSVALARFVPLGYENGTVDVYPEAGVPGTQLERLGVFHNVVGPGYFQTLGIELRSGRDFEPEDRESAPRVAIVSEALARRLWPGEDSLGREFRLSRDGGPLRVIGVAGNTDWMFVGEEPRPFLYLPLLQNYRSILTFHLRSSVPAESLAGAARGEVRGLDPALPVYDLKTMASHLRDGRALAFVRLGATLAAAFGALGLVLAIVGIYGVVSHAAAQRTYEIGIRMALGARRVELLRMVLLGGLKLATTGLAIGLAAGWALTRFMTSLLYGVSPLDPVTFAGASLMLSAAATAATFFPARRASAVDPLVALRYQ